MTAGSVPTPASLTFALTWSQSTCPSGEGHKLAHIVGTTPAATEHLGPFRYWCPTCQCLTLTAPEAKAALARAMFTPQPGQRGVVVAVSFPMQTSLERLR